jgi:hypothetical protein
MRVRCGAYVLIIVILALTLVGCLRSADGVDVPKTDGTDGAGEAYEAAGETLTDVRTEAPADDIGDTTEAPTEIPGDVPTEAVTEVPTESQDEPASEPPTEPAIESPTEAAPEPATEEVSSTPTVEIPEADFPLGIYVSENGGYKRVYEYVGAWPMNDVDPVWRVDTWTRPGFSHLIFDVAYFGIFPFEEPTHLDVDYSGEYMRLWREAGLTGYKIGLEFEIRLYDKTTQRFTVLSAEDTFACEQYLEIYLYDDVANATKWWYSHITPETTNENTMITTFKITLRDGCYRVKEIAVSAFAYKDACEFDENGFYTGSERTTAIIKRAKDHVEYERY